MTHVIVTEQDSNAEFRLHMGDELIVRLDAIPGTGYAWIVLGKLDVFTTPASETTLQHVLARLHERNIEGVIVDDGDDARKLVREKLPKGAEVHSGKSKTLQDAGI